MPMPNAQHAVIAAAKLRDYLLNPGHPEGGAKARLLLRMGYRRDDPSQLAADLRRDHLGLEPLAVVPTPQGVKYVVRGPVTSPTGATREFVTVWQIDHTDDRPRLITMYPAH